MREPFQHCRPEDLARGYSGGSAVSGAVSAGRRRESAKRGTDGRLPTVPATAGDASTQGDAALARTSTAAGGGVLPRRTDPHVPGAGLLHPVRVDAEDPGTQ